MDLKEIVGNLSEKIQKNTFDKNIKLLEEIIDSFNKSIFELKEIQKNEINENNKNKIEKTINIFKEVKLDMIHETLSKLSSLKNEENNIDEKVKLLFKLEKIFNGLNDEEKNKNKEIFYKVKNKLLQDDVKIELQIKDLLKNNKVEKIREILYEFIKKDKINLLNFTFNRIKANDKENYQKIHKKFLKELVLMIVNQENKIIFKNIINKMNFDKIISFVNEVIKNHQIEFNFIRDLYKNEKGIFIKNVQTELVKDENKEEFNKKIEILRKIYLVNLINFKDKDFEDGLKNLIEQSKKIENFWINNKKQTNSEKTFEFMNLMKKLLVHYLNEKLNKDLPLTKEEEKIVINLIRENKNNFNYPVDSFTNQKIKNLYKKEFEIIFLKNFLKNEIYNILEKINKDNSYSLDRKEKEGFISEKERVNLFYSSYINIKHKDKRSFRRNKNEILKTNFKLNDSFEDEIFDNIIDYVNKNKMQQNIFNTSFFKIMKKIEDHLSLKEMINEEKYNNFMEEETSKRLKKIQKNLNVLKKISHNFKKHKMEKKEERKELFNKIEEKLSEKIKKVIETNFKLK